MQLPTSDVATVPPAMLRTAEDNMPSEKAAAILIDAWRILQRIRAQDGRTAPEVHRERV